MKETYINNSMIPDTVVLDKITDDTITEVRKKNKRVERNSLDGNGHSPHCCEN